jgi:colicin import membrane protein
MRIAPAEKKPAASAVEQGEPLVMSRYPSPEPSTELATMAQLQAIVPSEFFKPNGSDAILTALTAEVRKQAALLDISTESRRAAIAALAYKVAKSKTALDKARKDLVADQKEALKAIDREGARIWDELEALQAEVRKPLTDWENAEKARVSGHEAALHLIVDAGQRASIWEDLDSIETQIGIVNQLFSGRNWEEFGKRADAEKSLALEHLGRAHDKEFARQAELKELARLRAAEVERKEAERLQKIADDAAAEERRKGEAVRLEQARLAEVERQRIADEAAQAEARAKQAEAQRIADAERAQREAQELAEKVERERIEAEQKARRESELAERLLAEAEQRRIKDAEFAEQKRVAAEKEAVRVLEAERVAAEKRQAEAIEAERKRVADEAERVRLETEKRERNKKHRERIESAAAEGLIFRFPMQIELARDLIKAISEGLIPNVTINY